MKEYCLTPLGTFVKSDSKVESEEEMKELRDKIDMGFTDFETIPDVITAIRLCEDLLKSFEEPIMPKNREVTELGSINRKFM